MSDGYQGTPGTGPGMPPPGGQTPPPPQPPSPPWQPTMPNPQAPVDPLWQPTGPGAAQPYPNQPPTQQVPTQPQWGATPPPGQYPPGQYSPPPQQPPAGRPRKQLLIGGGVAAALLAGGLAFGLTRGDDKSTAATTTVVTVVDETTVSTASSSTEPAPSTTAAALPADIDTIARSVVQLLAVDAAGNTIWTGSGTIISSDGLILTNAHVVENAPNDSYDHMVVAITETADALPVPTYRGEVVAFDAPLDLAVLKISADLDGTALTVAGLPFLPVGDSDSVGLGDNLRIFGYPGIGGDTITFTEGSVSGFTSEPGIPNRAWMKTDATIAGGNSGGTAVNAAGELVAVPTRAAATNEGDIVDCRVVQDTNGDNIIDENDSCIPIGGFINGLRPTNLALPLIEQGKLGEVVPTAPQVDPNVDTTGAFFSSPVFAPDVTANDEPTQVVQSLPSGSPKLCAFFDWEDVPNGATWDAAWSVNGEFNATYSVLAELWDAGPTGVNWWVCIGTNDGALEDGVYELALFIGDEQRTSNSVFVGDQYAPTNIEVFNGTSTEVCYLRLSPAGAQNWGPDELDISTTIPAATSVTLTAIGAVYDVLATDCDENVVSEQYGIDLSGGGRLTLTP